MTFPFPLFAKFSPLKVALYIAIILIVVIAVRYFGDKNNWLQKRYGIYEGFSQDKPFVLKQDNDIYDDFYIEIYDALTNAGKRTSYDVDNIIKITNVNNDTAYILDVGCGTGCIVDEFTKKGITIKGIDKSQSMINYANNKHPLLQNGTSSTPSSTPSSVIYQCMEAEDATVYERATFSHILSLYMTIYELKDKAQFFRNAFYGLQPGGYLVVHVVKMGDGGGDGGDGGTYHGFINLGKPKALDESAIVKSGIKQMQTDFGGFVYKRDWSSDTMLRERFIDHDSQSIRENELTLYYEPLKVVVEQVIRAGFVVYDNVPAYSDVGGELYFFKKPGAIRK